MTERQRRLVSKIQGYEGKDQKTSQSLSSVCSRVPARESEALKRWEESWLWGDRSSSSPGQWQNRNYRQRWHVMESFTLQLYRKGSRQNTCIDILYDRRDRERKERWNTSSATAMSPCLWYQARGEPNAREADRHVPLPKTSWAAEQPLCPGCHCGLRLEGWAFLSPWRSNSLQGSQISAGCWQQWSWELVLMYLFQFATHIFTVPPVAWRYQKAKRVSQETSEPQPLLQKHWTTAAAESQPTAPYHNGPASRRAVWGPIWNTQVVWGDCLAVGSPPTPKGLVLDHGPCAQPPPSWHHGDSRRSHPKLSSAVGCELAYFYSEERLKDGWVREQQSPEAVPAHRIALAPTPTTGPGWLGSKCHGFALYYGLRTGWQGLFSFGSKWK